MIRIAALLIAFSGLVSAEWVNLWPEDAPGAKPLARGAEKPTRDGHLTDIEVPQYEVFLPDTEKATGAAVVIFPGGGYTFVSIEPEGRAYAKWLNEQGIAGIVVKYRVSGDPRAGYHYPVPLLDARRAIRTVRANAKKWGINPRNVGVMGSSAGGHLASMCATRFADTFDEEIPDDINAQDCRPDFAILLYPVISMTGDLSHTRSKRQLLGDKPAEELQTRCSTQLWVTKRTPPVFLLTTADDYIDMRHSLDFAAACKANQVPVSLHVFEKGGHGYGLQGSGDLKIWPQLLEMWLDSKRIKL